MTDTSVGHKFKVSITTVKSNKLSTEDIVKLAESLDVVREEPQQQEVVRPEVAKEEEQIQGEERIKQMINKFGDFLEAADSMRGILGEKLKNYTVTVPINEEPGVRDAIRRLFGKNSNTITYEMFEQCLQWRSEIINSQRRQTYNQTSKGE